MSISKNHILEYLEDVSIGKYYQDTLVDHFMIRNKLVEVNSDDNFLKLTEYGASALYHPETWQELTFDQFAAQHRN